MEFIPQQSKEAADVPYFEDARAEGGWKGQATQKSVKHLKSEITEAISRLGGMVIGIQEGTFADGKRKRDGLRLFYNMGDLNGVMRQGQIDVAALPVRRDNHRQQAIRMALFMLRDALDGLWFLQQFSPGYAALMPFMLVENGKTVTQLWSEQGAFTKLLPRGVEFVDGEVIG